jgi:mannosyl-oligosaccharide alpha-1,2-mannosidase
VETNLDFDQAVKDVNFFETTIRILGALLSNYSMTKHPVLLQKAIDLGDRLSVAFHSKAGIPHSVSVISERVLFVYVCCMLLTLFCFVLFCITN